MWSRTFVAPEGPRVLKDTHRLKPVPRRDGN